MPNEEIYRKESLRSGFKQVMTCSTLGSYLSTAFILTSALAQETFPMTIKGDIGKAVVFQKIPQRVIAIGAENIELLSVMYIKPVGFAVLKGEYALGKKPTAPMQILGNNILGDSAFVSLSRQPSIETIVNLRPDLVLTYGTASSPEPHQALSGVVPTVAYDFDTPHTWREPLKEMGRLFRKTEKVSQYIRQYDNKINRFKVKIAPIIRKSAKTTFLYMPDASRVMLLGNKFSFGKALTTLGMKIDTPAGVDANMMFLTITAESLLNHKHQRIVILGLEGYEKNEAANVAFEYFRKKGIPLFVYKMPENQPYSGPLTDLKRVEAMVNLINK